MDVYDPESNGWTVETAVPTPRYHAGITLVGERLFVVGGLRDSGGFSDRATGQSL